MKPNFELISSFTNVLDVVDGTPDAIGDLRDFLHFYCSANRSVGVRLDSANVDDGGSVGQQVLNLDGEIRQDTRDAVRSNPLVEILVRGPCVRATTT